MSNRYVDRSRDEEIIDIVRSVLDNVTVKAKQHNLLNKMQIQVL